MNKLLFFLSFILLFGCKNKQERTEFSLPRDQFKHMLTELHLFEGRFAIQTFREDSLRPELMTLYDSIFVANDVDKQAFFDDYFAYVRNQPDQLDTIYQELTSELESRRDSIRNSEEIDFEEIGLDEQIGLADTVANGSLQPNELKRTDYDD